MELFIGAWNSLLKIEWGILPLHASYCWDLTTWEWWWWCQGGGKRVLYSLICSSNMLSLSAFQVIIVAPPPDRFPLLHLYPLNNSWKKNVFASLKSYSGRTGMACEINYRSCHIFTSFEDIYYLFLYIFFPIGYPLHLLLSILLRFHDLLFFLVFILFSCIFLHKDAC